MADNAPKKRPGRPRKNPQVSSSNIEGIVKEPLNPENVVEVVYQNPSIIKKFFNTFNTYQVVEIKVIFSETGLKMIALDHLQKSTIICSIDGSKTKRYYCAEPMSFGINNTYLRNLRSIEKSNTEITFSIREATKDSIFSYTLYDPELKSYDSMDINMIEIPDLENLAAQSDDGYPIKFEISASRFKGLITNIQGMKVSSFSIQKCHDEPLCIIYGLPGKSSSVKSFGDDEAIKLHSEIAENEIFSITLEVAYIKRFSSATLGDTIKISADRTKDIMLESCLDCDAGLVRVFTQITKII